MNELLTNPAFQSGVAPFFVALIISAVLQRTMGWFWAGFGLIAAFLVNVFFTTGFEMTPLTSTRKIVLLGIVCTRVCSVDSGVRSPERDDVSSAVPAALRLYLAMVAFQPVVAKNYL